MPMHPTQVTAATDCATLSCAGSLSFGEVVGRLIAVGIERYHADYSRHEITYYTPDGDSCVVALGPGDTPVASAFSGAGIVQAVRQAQAGTIRYPEFSRQAQAAGCVGYVVHLTGKRVHYFGRLGDIHTEWFPGAAP